MCGCLPASGQVADAGARFDAANELYAQNKFAEAAGAYEQLLKNGVTTPAVYFNLGNAYFKSGEMGRAIAAFRAAGLMTPRDPDLRANLQFARNQVQGPKVVPGRLESWLGTFSSGEWLVGVTILVWLTLGLTIVRLLKPSWKSSVRSWTWISAGCALLVIAGAIGSITLNAADKHAVVIKADATVRNGPFDESPSTFTAHDGAELLVLDQKKDWLQVTDGTTRMGWLKRDAVVF